MCCILCLVGGGGFSRLAARGGAPSNGRAKGSAASFFARPPRALSALPPLGKTNGRGASIPRKRSDFRRELQRNGVGHGDRVTVVREVSGLRINCLLEPAYYLGMLKFPGAERLFPYTRLLQATNLSDEDPYDASRVPIAENDLREFLHRNGYFQASVHADSAI